jgi:hypothetical protein
MQGRLRAPVFRRILERRVPEVGARERYATGLAHDLEAPTVVESAGITTSIPLHAFPRLFAA